jgi:tetratricopeptide (TPR) repeat protein
MHRHEENAMKSLRKPLVSLITAIALLQSGFARADLDTDVQHLQQRWAEVNYQLDGNTQLSAFEQLVADADKIVAANPGAAEALIWSGIIKSTYAGAKGGLGALSLAKASKADLEQALELNPEALQGSAYTSLGALYYSVPGWPIGFGDDDKAEELLKQALKLNPDGIDTNYFYADFLIAEHEYAAARTYLLKAQQAAPRPGRTLADSGRQQEISAKLQELPQP